MDDLNRRMHTIETRFDRLDERVSFLSTEHVRTDSSFREFRTALESRIENLEESMEKSLSDMATKLDLMVQRFSGTALLEKGKLIGEVILLLVALWAILHGSAPPPK